MIKSSKHIEIARSTMKGLSSMSQESCDSIFSVLCKNFTSVGVSVINSIADLERLVVCHPDLVFMGMKFIPANPISGANDPNKIWLSDVFDRHGISYTGSSKIAHELEYNKPLAKQRIIDANLKTPAFCVVKQYQSFSKNDIPLDFPLFIKPTSRGGGLGIDSDSVVNDFEQLRTKVHLITTKLQSDALIEVYLPGREFSVGILRDEKSSALLSLPIELIAPPDNNGSRLLSSRVKSSNTEQASKVFEGLTKARVTKLAINAFNALGGRDYGRIDIRLDMFGTPYFLEANLIPSLISGYGSFPKACIINNNLEYESMIMRIVELGFDRKANEIIDTEEDIMLAGQDTVPTESALKLT